MRMANRWTAWLAGVLVLVGLGGCAGGMMGGAEPVSVTVSDLRMGTAGVIGFWRQSTNDGTYNIFSEVQRMPGSSEARHVGTQSTLMYVYTPTPHVTMVFVAAYFQAGRFLHETPPGENVVYLTGWWAYRF